MTPSRCFLLLLAGLLLACGSPTTPAALSPSAVPPTDLPTPTLPTYPHLVATEEPTPAPTPAETAYPSPPPEETASPPPPPELYFLSNRGGQVDLWRILPEEGAEAEPVTGDEVEEQWPAFSPDGRVLAYAALEEAQATVRLLDLETGATVVVEGSGTAGPIERLAWADAETLLYSVRDPERGRVLFRVGPDGVARPLEAAGWPDGAVLLDWTAAAGHLVLAVGRPGESSTLYRVDEWLEGQLPLGEAIAEGTHPLLAPAGPWLLYQSPPYDDDPIGYLLNLEAGVSWPYNQGATLRRWDHDWAWSPAGDMLALARSSWAWTGEDGRPFYVGEAGEPAALDGQEGLYQVVLEAETWQLTRVGYDTAPAWSPNGRFLAFVSNRDAFNRSDLWLLDLMEGSARLLVGAGGNDWSPLWRPR